MNSINTTARIAGFLYFMYIVTSFMANIYGRFVFVDAPVTVNHIMAVFVKRKGDHLLAEKGTTLVSLPEL